MLFEPIERGLTDAARWRIDDAAQGDVITRIDHQAKIGQRILDLRPLVERRAPRHDVGHLGISERLFEHTAERIDSIQHRHLSPWGAIR